MSTAILHNTFKTTTPLVDATVDETLLLGDYRSLQFSAVLNFVCGRLVAERASQTA